MKPIILASESPRRRELLLKAGYNFDVLSVKVSEIPNENLNAEEQILDIARRKSRHAMDKISTQSLRNFILITADTEVIYQGRPLGKPNDPDDAFRILKLLSGTTHQVITAICVTDSETQTELCQFETTHIVFKELSDDLIWNYIKTGEPMDKAGAYGIQGQGREFIEEFQGDFNNVVGLPLELLKKMLAQLEAK